MTESNTSAVPSLAELIDTRLSRRTALKALVAGAGGAALASSGLARAAAAQPASSLRFTSPPHTIAHYQPATAPRC